MLDIVGLIRTCKTVREAYSIYNAHYDQLVKTIPYFKGGIKPIQSSGVSSATYIWCIFNNKMEWNKCVICDCEIGGSGFKRKPTCSKSCAMVLRKYCTQLQYGVNNVAQLKTTQDKIANTSLQRYGHSRSMKNSDIKRKRDNTCTAKYGVSNPMKNVDVKQKQLDGYYSCDPDIREQQKQSKIETVKQRYGVDNVAKVPEIRDKIIQTSIKSSLSHLSEEAIESFNDSDWLRFQHHDCARPIYHIAKELNVHALSLSKQFHRLQIDVKYYFSSQAERDIMSFIQSLGVKCIGNDKKTIAPQELDIYCPNERIAIEYDGIFWHGEQQGKDKRYHLNKTMLCQAEGIRLIHIWENEWLNTPDIVKSRIRALFNKTHRIYGRKCNIVQLDSAVANRFNTDNHIQGAVKCSINYGLEYNGELVSVMSLDRSRFSNKYQYELVRFCTKIGNNVIGGASKIFKCIVKDIVPKSIVSYSDLRWNVGSVYNQLGFMWSHRSKPNYFYFQLNDLTALHSRQTFQKHKLKNKLDCFDSNLTEYQNMVNAGYDRIWDCGNDVFVWNNV